MPDSYNNEIRGELVIYQTEDQHTRVQVRLEEESVWMTQSSMAELFQTTPQNITLHLKAIYDEQELDEESTCKRYLQVQQEGTREVSREREFYNLQAILAVGYRVRSHRGTQFRKWATDRLNEYLVKGFTMDDERLKEGPNIGSDYFDELLERIRDIRASEKRFYHKIRDIYRLAVDYDPKAEDQARRRKEIYMKDWRQKLDAFLQFNERDILENPGKVSKEIADLLALEQYESYHKARLNNEAEGESICDDEELKELQDKLEGRKG